MWLEQVAEFYGKYLGYWDEVLALLNQKKMKFTLQTLHTMAGWLHLGSVENWVNLFSMDYSFNKATYIAIFVILLIFPDAQK